MKNEKIFKDSKLIPLLIKYVKVNKVVFPIDRVKYLSNEEVIEILKDCINNQMKALSKNIMVLEKIEKDYGSLIL